MDWNIFFSTISTASGAIVGIFSAFLITKIVSDQKNFLSDRRKLNSLLNKSRFLKNETANREFEDYNEQCAKEALFEVEKFYKDGCMDLDELFRKINFSPFQGEHEVKSQIKRKVDELVDKDRVGYEDNDSLRNILPREIRESYWLGAGEERERIDAVRVRIKLQIDTNLDFLNEIGEGKNSSRLVSISIVSVLFLFFAGVIYPLSFIPFPQGAVIDLSVKAFWEILFSFRGLLMGIISVIFSGLMIAFLRVNMSLVHDEENISSLKKFCKLEYYSEFFKNYEENTSEN